MLSKYISKILQLTRIVSINVFDKTNDTLYRLSVKSVNGVRSIKSFLFSLLMISVLKYILL